MDPIAHFPDHITEGKDVAVSRMRLIISLQRSNPFFHETIPLSSLVNLVAGVLKELKELPEIFLSADVDLKCFVSFELFAALSGHNQFGACRGPLERLDDLGQ